MAVKDHKEWLLQAASDLETADVLLEASRYIHCVFFCHLAVEKALKAMVFLKHNQEPPKTHNLNALLKKADLAPPPDLKYFIDELSLASVPTRYPEELRAISKDYSKIRTKKSVEKS